MHQNNNNDNKVKAQNLAVIGKETLNCALDIMGMMYELHFKKVILIFSSQSLIFSCEHR